MNLWAWRDRILPRISFRLWHGFCMMQVFIVGPAYGLGWPPLKVIFKEIYFVITGRWLLSD